MYAYVLDFYCHEARLAIEVDGGSHRGTLQQRKDAERQAAIEALGIRFLRLDDAMVRRDVYAALAEIERAVSPSPAEAGEGAGG